MLSLLILATRKEYKTTSVKYFAGWRSLCNKASKNKIEKYRNVKEMSKKKFFFFQMT